MENKPTNYTVLITYTNDSTTVYTCTEKSEAQKFKNYYKKGKNMKTLDEQKKVTVRSSVILTNY